MSRRSAQHVQRISFEAAAVLDRLARKTGRDKADAASRLIVKSAMWGDAVVLLTLDSVPPQLLGKDLFWQQVEEDLIRGLHRCREKYREGKG